MLIFSGWASSYFGVLFFFFKGLHTPVCWQGILNAKLTHCIRKRESKVLLSFRTFHSSAQ